MISSKSIEDSVTVQLGFFGPRLSFWLTIRAHDCFPLSVYRTLPLLRGRIVPQQYIFSSTDQLHLYQRFKLCNAHHARISSGIPRFGVNETTLQLQDFRHILTVFTSLCSVLFQGNVSLFLLWILPSWSCWSFCYPRGGSESRLAAFCMTFFTRLGLMYYSEQPDSRIARFPFESL